MEQHPVPQNVTTFQFRLIGDMTIKQFGYLCAGAILAFIAYRLPLPFIITWPLAFALAFLGVGFAFIPIEERPMDVWVFSFFKSIYNPTQYIWTKTEPHTEPVRMPEQKITTAPKPQRAPLSPQTPAPPSKTALSNLFQQAAHANPSAHNPLPSEAKGARSRPSFFSWLSDLWSPKTAPSTHTNTLAFSNAPAKPVTGYRPQPVAAPAPQHPAKQPNAEELDSKQKMAQLEASLKKLQAQLATSNVASDRILELQQQLTEVLQHKKNAEEELTALKRKLMPHGGTQTQPAQPDTPPSDTKGSPAPKSTVTAINTQDAAVKIGLPRLTNYPNVITGIVKDNAANLLPGILITVTNKDGMPVRALKTNKLGQFGASTPLGEGVYFVEIEDPRKRYAFSRVQITLSGSVVPALEIIAKSSKQLTREKLTQEIFGNNSI